MYNPAMPADAQPRLIDHKKPLLMVMDGHAMVHRSFHAIQQPLSISKTGEDVRAVFGFMNTFLRALQDWEPTHCAVAFDPHGPTFRHKRFDDYKAHRPATPPELRPQFDRVRDLVKVLRIPMYQAEGFEADDAIGTICRQAEEQGVDTLILTGDTDTLQLVTPHVSVALTFSVQQKTLYDVAKVRERYDGLGPEVVADIKALEGDTSDNIPGVPGVGKKTAIKLIQQFGSIEGIIEHIDEVTPAGTQKKLEDAKESMVEGKILTTIVRDVPVTLDLDDAKFWTYDRSKVVEALSDLEFFTMVARVPDPHGGDGPEVEGQLSLMEANERQTRYEVVDTAQSLDAMVRALDTADGFAFSTTMTKVNPMLSDLVGLGFSNEANKGWYVPVGHTEGAQLDRDAVLDALRPIFASSDVPKTAYDASHHMTVLAKGGVEVNNLTLDVVLAAHLTGRKALAIEALALERLNIEMTPVAEVVGTGRKQVTMAEVAIESAADYAAAIADVTYQLIEGFEKELEEKKSREVLDTVELPLVPVIVRMQVNGVRLDVDVLEDMAEELAGQISSIESDMYGVVGHEFNINSSQQLGDVLFNELRLPATKKTKTGYSTDASALEGLQAMMKSEDVDPKMREALDKVDPRAPDILDKVLYYRQVTKIKSTYVDALPGLVNPETGRIHTIYNQTGSATGRVSSNDPNVQNIPVRTELGRRVRRAFVATDSPEWTLFGADYSQIELRILAYLSQDPGLLEAFRKGQDIHAATASSVYGVELDEIDSEMRRVAKIMNFGVVYGLSAFGISRQTGLSPEEGKTFIKAYFGKYPGIKDYVDSTKQKVRELGYVETLMGRRRYIPEIQSTSFHVRGAGERMAINMPIQGAAADAIKIAMVRIQQRLDEAELRSLMIVQVHDELIFEAPQEELDDLKSIVLDVMPSALDIDVPLDVDLKTGPNWGDME